MTTTTRKKAEPEDRRRALSFVLTNDEFRPLSSTVKVEFGARSHPGRVRTLNEDHYMVMRLNRGQETLATSLPQSEVPPRFEEFGYAMLVADGLGGSGAGGVASRLAVGALAHLALHYGKWNVRVDSRTAADIVERLQWSYGQIDRMVSRRGEAHGELEGMATTLTAAYSAGDEVFVAHVGHSRAYLFRDGALTQLTKDQTLSARLLRAQRPVNVARATDGLRHVLTDAIGASGARTPQIQIDQHKLRTGDCLLLCTDGLTAHVADDLIAETLTERRRLDDLCQRLVDLALESGGSDNVTAVLAQYTVPPMYHG